MIITQLRYLAHYFGSFQRSTVPQQRGMPGDYREAIAVSPLRGKVRLILGTGMWHQFPYLYGSS